VVHWSAKLVYTPNGQHWPYLGDHLAFVGRMSYILIQTLKTCPNYNVVHECPIYVWCTCWMLLLHLLHSFVWVILPSDLTLHAWYTSFILEQLFEIILYCYARIAMKMLSGYDKISHKRIPHAKFILGVLYTSDGNESKLYYILL